MRALFTLLLIVATAACTHGPDVDTLRTDVTAQLAQALPGGTIALVSLERRGSQRDPKAPAGETRRVLYFDIALKLERDFDFGAWDAPGVAGLISALGAGPKGITGIVTRGNKAGDVIRAHGTSLYTQEGDRWVAVVPAGYEPPTAPTYATDTPQTHAAAILAAIRKAIESLPADVASTQRAVIEQELSAAHTTIRARLARATNGYAIAAGPEHGQYQRFAQALSLDGGVRIVGLVTRGGEENIQLLRDGKVALAIAQGDAALAAYEGSGSFASHGGQADLRALGSLYPESLHVFVRADARFKTIESLKGRKIAIGEHGSASRTTALRVLEAHGLDTTNVTPIDIPLGNALDGLRRGELDAVIQVIGVPADVFRNALAELPLRLLPLSARAIGTLESSNTGYFSFLIPQGAYAGQREDVRTVATAALLLAAADLSDTEVDTLTRFVFDARRDLTTRGSAQGTLVSAATARRGLTIPLHRSAAKALESATGPQPTR